jgi:hypothetical protein
MVNSAEQSVTATFSGLPPANRLDLFAGTSATTPGGSFSITLPPLAVRAFRFVPPPNSPPAILPGINADASNFNFQFAGTTGLHYRVEFASTLPASGPWQTVTDIVSLSVSPAAISHPLTNRNGFYRVGLVP